MLDLERQSNSSWSEKNSFSSEENEIELKMKRPSPRTVLDICEEDSNSCNSIDEEDSNILCKKPRSPILELISSFFRLSCDRSMRKIKEKEQPLVRCFTYQEITNATNNFHTGIYMYILDFSIFNSLTQENM